MAPPLAKATSDLAAAGVDSPRADAEWLAAHVLGVNRGRLMLIDTIREIELRRFTALVAERARRIPLQHLLGTAAFRHLELAVGDGVFVPRPETELLAGWGIKHTEPGATVVDLCSGSGAIALSVAQEARPGRVIAVERSPSALVWLRRNKALLMPYRSDDENGSGASRGGSAGPDGLAESWGVLRIVEGDVTDPGLLADLRGVVDVVLCNPPYVPDGTPVPPEVSGHDPAEAVFAGADGLGVIRPVIALAAALLRPGGVVGIEHDDVHASAVPGLLLADGRFDQVTEHDDLTGRPRYATARRV